MSWRGQGITGSNNIPLGNRRRFGGDEQSPSSGDGGYTSTQPSSTISETYKRGRSPVRELSDDGTKKRKKRNRWGDAQENKAAGLMGLPTMIMANMTNEQLEAYTLHLRIEEISQKLRINDVVPADGDRSPSPPPQYDNFGRRVNTREYRYRKRLEDERHKLIEKAMKVIPNYHPPSDYRRPTKTQEKVYVPVNDYPEINFIGLLIGPRGNTLKKMETESQAKIAIRGKGSVKEGKGRSDAAHTSNQEEDLHCLIMADTEEKVNKAKKLIHNVIETVRTGRLPDSSRGCLLTSLFNQAASIPEGQNELKRNQLRELAALNGTLRDDENQACQNCGEIGHRKYDCPEQRNFTSNIICRTCGNAGHMARDCPDRQRGTNWRNDGPPGPGGRAPPGRSLGPGDAHDREYEQLMQELSGGAPAGSGDAPRRIEGGPEGYDNGGRDPSRGGEYDGDRDRNVKPWERGPTGAAAPWQSRGRDGRDGQDDYQQGGSGSAPPWASGGGGRGSDRHGYGGPPAGGYGAPPPPSGGAAPWQQQSAPPGGAPGYGGYGGYPGAGYGDHGSGYPPHHAMGAPPGLGAGAPGGLGAPPGLGSVQQVYPGYGAGASPPPPPPPGSAPPPPPPVSLHSVPPDALTA
ncbi:MAG: hypothetical protein M1825_006427 [Sarcosagium campestre]|nr:MAG: hypothetical protein M1825_006427 [Sarcosagium campestre]